MNSFLRLTNSSTRNIPSCTTLSYSSSVYDTGESYDGEKRPNIKVSSSITRCKIVGDFEFNDKVILRHVKELYPQQNMPRA
jgi:hypothetical protein